jgi:hypothetical protein
MSDKILYEKALNEFINNKDEALWIKSLVECSGDQEKAKFFYIKLRVEELDNNIKDTLTPSSLDTLDKFLSQGSFHFEGLIKDNIEKTFCRIVNTKKYSDVLSDLYISKNFIVLIPSSSTKNTRSIELTGLLGGTIGISLMHSFAQSRLNKQSDKIKDKLNGLENCVILDAGTCEIKAKEISGGFLGEDQFWVMIEGDSTFNGAQERISIRFELSCILFGAIKKNKATVTRLCSRIGKPTPIFYKDKKVLTNGVF